MCDPGSLIGAGLGAGTKVADAMGRQRAAQQQDRANKENAMRQLFLMNQHLNQQDAFRRQGEGAWSGALDDLSAAAQISQQTHEAARLASYLNGDTQPITDVTQPSSLSVATWQDHPIDAGPGGKGIARYTDTPAANTSVAPPPSKNGGFSFDPNINGSTNGGNVFKADLARKLALASRDARGQINALANLSSYGGSYAGNGTLNPMILQNSARGIDMHNNFRRGDMNVWNVESQIPASQYQYKQSPLMGLSGLFGAGMKGLGSTAGGSGF